MSGLELLLAIIAIGAAVTFVVWFLFLFVLVPLLERWLLPAGDDADSEA